MTLLLQNRLAKLLSDNFMFSFGDLIFFEPIKVFLLPRKPMYSLDVRGKPLSQAEQWPDASSLGKRASFKTSSPQGLVVKDLTIQVPCTDMTLAPLFGKAMFISCV